MDVVVSGCRDLRVWGSRMSRVWPMGSRVLGVWVSKGVRDTGVPGLNWSGRVWEFREPGKYQGDVGVLEVAGVQGCWDIKADNICLFWIYVYTH